MTDFETNVYSSDNTSIKELRKKYIIRGLSGLINLGNTCYMNAAIQCLSSTDLLISYFRSDSDDFKNDLKNNVISTLKSKHKTSITKDQVIEKFKQSLSYSLRNLLIVMWGENRKVEPKTFKKCISNLKKTFSGFDQNDSQECLSFILDQIHEETKTDVEINIINLPDNIEEYNTIRNKFTELINDDNISLEDKIKYKEIYDEYKKEHLHEDAFFKGLMFWKTFLNKNHSVIIDIFTGLYFSEVVCENCNNHTFKFDPFNIINLSINNVADNSSLEECLEKNFLCSEKLIDDNKYYCEKCKEKFNATKKILLWHSPDRLIIQMKRFTNSLSKINKNINYPLTDLNMKRYFSKYNISESEKLYDLYAVIHHYGSFSGGHYVAYTKNPINNEWYLFDDTNVLHINNDLIKDRIVSNDAYVLFYKKKD